MSASFGLSLKQKQQKLGKGILTLAHGKPRYLNMAKTLAMSLQLHNDRIPRAVITDSSDPDLSRLYHICIPFRPEFGTGVQQKIYLDQYSPFEETIFIDSDCIVVNNIENLWHIFANVSFGVVGRQIFDGYWFMDVSKVLSHFGLDSIPKFNGGLYYFKSNDQADAIFKSAREILQNYRQLELREFRGSQADEPIIAIALALHGIHAIKDYKRSIMCTPIGLRGPLKIDALSGFCQFNKGKVEVNPAVVHFCGTLTDGFYEGFLYKYRRERLKLHLTKRSRRINFFISWLVNVIFYPPYMISQVFWNTHKLYNRRIRKLLGSYLSYRSASKASKVV